MDSSFESGGKKQFINGGTLDREVIFIPSPVSKFLLYSHSCHTQFIAPPTGTIIFISTNFHYIGKKKNNFRAAQIGLSGGIWVPHAQCRCLLY